MKNQLLIGITLCLGLLTAPMASMASLGRAEAATYQAKSQTQTKRVAKATKTKSGKSVRTVPRQQRPANTFKGGEMPKSASCSKRSNTSLFAQTAFAAPVDKTVKSGVNQRAIN